MTYYSNQFDRPELTFVSSQEDFEKNLNDSELYYPFVLLRFRPKCDCGKEFRSSGNDSAHVQVQKHVEYKKYAKCTPTIEELKFNVPEFVTMEQIWRTEANALRNTKLRNQIDDAEWYDKASYMRDMRQNHNLILLDDGRFWNTRLGEEVIPTKFPKKIDGYQIGKNINLKATVIKKSDARNVVSKKSGDSLTVCEIVIADSFGEVSMTLWNGDCTRIKTGDKVVIKNAFVKDAYQGGIELGLYKNASKIEVVNS